MTATSSAVVERTVPSVAAAAPPAPAVTWPNAPKRTFAIERFIARPIISVSSVPEAPTSMPLTMSTLFSSSNPVAAAARPVQAFSSEITTGMSAPPIGSTNMHAEDERAARSSPTAATGVRRPTTIATAAARQAPMTSALTAFWPG